MSKLSTQPLKGFRDFLPEDIQVRNYIFDVWKEVCLAYGFEEYDGPILEKTEIYQKSGEDVGSTGKELYSFKDKGDRKVALRPEMTPTVGRMIAEYGDSLVKPIRWFSVGQFFRAEKPQRGRGREFFQLNADIFGDDSILSDFEIISLMLDIMLKLKATEKMFTFKINNRKFTNYYFEKVMKIESQEQQLVLLKIIDAYPKKDDDWLKMQLKKNLKQENLFEQIKTYLSLKLADIEKYKNDSQGAKEIIELFALLKIMGTDKYCCFDTTIARGFDYYTGVVFEIFDLNPQNNRSMFGGGRYDDLLNVFGKKPIPAVGVAPGDMTTELFLRSWNLLPNFESMVAKCLVVVFNETVDRSIKISNILRENNISTEIFLSLHSPLPKQLKYANKKKIPWVVIVGEEEMKTGKVSLKNMQTGEQEMVSEEKLVMIVQRN